MKIIDNITSYFSNFRDYVSNEIELVKLSVMRKVGNILGLIFSVFFIIFLFHVTVALIGIWLGFWLSEIYDSTSIGFGVTVLIYMTWLIVSIIFRNALLIKPFSRLIMSSIIELEELEKIEKENEN